MQIVFPAYSFEVREFKGIRQIRDNIRKQFVAITPEEWVRQHILRYMVEELCYPPSRIAVEQGIQLAGGTKRTDITVYDQELKPWLLVECKSPDVKISNTVLDQANAYNMKLGATWIVLCNGTDIIIADARPGAKQVMNTTWPVWKKTR